MLTERQRKADTLARELQAAGATVTSPLPLGDAPLRFRVLASLAGPILEDLKQGGWTAHFLSSGPEFRFDGTTPHSHLYEIDIPTPLTPVWDDRIPRTELASSEK